MSDLADHPHYQAYTQAFRIGCPVVISVGVIGNVMSLIVLRSKFFRYVPSSVGFTLLAVVDLCILLIGLLPSWIGNITDGEHEIRAMGGQAGCKAHVFLTYFFAFLGPWTLVLINVERCISVVTPDKHSSICTSRNILIGWVFIFVPLFGSNLHFIWTYQFVRSSNVTTADIVYDCYHVPQHQDFHLDIWPWVDFAVSFAGPFTIILVCSLIIIFTLCRQRNAYRQELDGRKVSYLDKVTSTTAMLVTTSVVYMLTTSPIVIVTLLMSYGKISMATVPEMATSYLIIILVNLVFYINSAVNFLLYFVSNSHFRKSAKHLFCCQCYSPDGNDGDSISSWKNVNANQTEMNNRPDKYRY